MTHSPKAHLSSTLKKLSASLFFLCLMSLLSLTNCTFVEKKISQEQDAKVAYKQNLPDLESFRYSDLGALRRIIDDHLQKYQVGLAYLQKVANLYEGQDGVKHDKKVVKTQILLNELEAITKNLKIIYPDQWDQEKIKLKEKLDALKNQFDETYKGLI